MQIPKKDLQLLSNLQVVTDHREDIHGACWAPQGHATLGEFIHIDDLWGSTAQAATEAENCWNNLFQDIYIYININIYVY